MLFKTGDKVVHKNDPSYKGTITKTKYVPKKGLSHGNYQFIWLDNSLYPCGSTSEYWELDVQK